MAKIDLQYDLANYTPANASPIEANFNRIEQHINQEVIERGGTVAMAAQLQLVGDPVTALDAAPKQYVDQVLPLGIIMMFGGTTAPPGGRWAVCNGAELASASYPDLFLIIGNNFSPAGTPAGRFHLPNMVDRMAIGSGNTTPIGQVGGSRDAVVPNHTHPIDHGHASGTSSAVGDHNHAGVDHLHSDDHNHSGTSDAMDRPSTHHHAMGITDSGAVGSGLATGLMSVFSGTTVNTYDTDINHLHTFTTNFKSQQGYNTTTGAADRSLTTGLAGGHSHSTPVNPMSGASGSASGGTSPANANMPPYIGVSHIMRIS